MKSEKMMEIESRIKKVIVGHAGLTVTVDEIDSSEEYFLEKYGFNSVDALELLLRIEEEFDIEISDENLNSNLIKTVESISEYVYEKLLKNS